MSESQKTHILISSQQAKHTREGENKTEEHDKLLTIKNKYIYARNICQGTLVNMLKFNYAMLVTLRTWII